MKENGVSLRELLENLISISNNANHQYTQVAENTEGVNPQLAFDFRAMAEIRKHHAKNLTRRLKELEEDYAEGTCITGPLQGGFTPLGKNEFPDRVEEIIYQTIDSEEGTFRAYSQALEPRLDPATEWLLIKHRSQIETCLRDLRLIVAA